MTRTQRLWAQARDRLAVAAGELGYPADLADVLARQLKSPKAIDRMAVYMKHVRPRSMEMIADEALAICADTDAWREKIRNREAQAGYEAWLASDLRRRNGEADDFGGCASDTPPFPDIWDRPGTGDTEGR